MHLDDATPGRENVFKPAQLNAPETPVSIGPPPRFRQRDRLTNRCDVSSAREMRLLPAAEEWTLGRVGEYLLFVAGINAFALLGSGLAFGALVRVCHTAALTWCALGGAAG